MKLEIPACPRLTKAGQGVRCQTKRIRHQGASPAKRRLTDGFDLLGARARPNHRKVVEGRTRGSGRGREDHADTQKEGPAIALRRRHIPRRVRGRRGVVGWWAPRARRALQIGSSLRNSRSKGTHGPAFVCPPGVGMPRTRVANTGSICPPRMTCGGGRFPQSQKTLLGGREGGR